MPIYTFLWNIHFYLHTISIQILYNHCGRGKQLILGAPRILRTTDVYIKLCKYSSISFFCIHTHTPFVRQWLEHTNHRLIPTISPFHPRYLWIIRVTIYLNIVPCGIYPSHYHAYEAFPNLVLHTQVPIPWHNIISYHIISYHVTTYQIYQQHHHSIDECRMPLQLFSLCKETRGIPWKTV